MKNIILFTHGDFSKGIASSCQLILGDIQEFKTLSVSLDEGIDEVKKKLQETIESFSNEEPVLIVTDIPGGSTTQTVISVMNQYDHVYVVTGMNLGLLMSLVFLNFTDNKEDNLALIRDAIESSKDGIYLVNDVIGHSEELLDDDEL